MKQIIILRIGAVLSPIFLGIAFIIESFWFSNFAIIFLLIMSILCIAYYSSIEEENDKKLDHK